MNEEAKYLGVFFAGFALLIIAIVLTCAFAQWLNAPGSEVLTDVLSRCLILHTPAECKGLL